MQAQFQSGRKGNYNWGAYRGTKFTASEYQRNCQTSYSDVTEYEWAALFAHSTPVNNALHMYEDLEGSISVGGVFTNINDNHAWTKKTSGGYKNGAYDDCIGLLYAMGYAGLTSLVNTVPTRTTIYFTSYTSTLGGGNNFGTSYRAFAQTYYPTVTENFMLFGAGPLVAEPYSP